MNRSRFTHFITWLSLAFLYAPVAVLILTSFNASRFGGDFEGFTFRWYRELWVDQEIWEALVNSLVVGFSSAFAATVLGTLAAIALHTFHSKLQKIHFSLIYAPLVIPDILMGMSLLVLFVTLGIQLGLGTIFIAHTTFCLSYVTLIVLSRLQNFDMTTVEAAQDLGASWWTVQYRVVLPQLLPGIAAGFLLAFTMSFDDFIITYFVAGPGSATLPVHIYGMIKYGTTPVINALSTLILGLTLLAFLASQKLIKQEA